jgi:hypothetical protein
MVQTGLAGTVGKGLERGHPQTIDTANVDNACRVVRSRGFLQEGSNQLCEIEDTMQVEGEDASKGLAGILIVWGTPVRAGVVDKDVELCRSVRRISKGTVSKMDQD